MDRLRRKSWRGQGWRRPGEVLEEGVEGELGELLALDLVDEPRRLLRLRLPSEFQTQRTFLSNFHTIEYLDTSSYFATTLWFFVQRLVWICPRTAKIDTRAISQHIRPDKYVESVWTKGLTQLVGSVLTKTDNAQHIPLCGFPPTAAALLQDHKNANADSRSPRRPYTRYRWKQRVPVWQAFHRHLQPPPPSRRPCWTPLATLTSPIDCM